MATVEELVTSVENPSLAQKLEKITHDKLLASAYKDIKKLVERSNVAFVDSRYKIGERVKQLRDDYAKAGREYGESIMKNLSQVLGLGDGELYFTLRLVEQFNQEEVAKICKLRTTTGRSITLAHLRVMVQYPEASHEEWLKQVVDNDWTSSELYEELKEKYKSKKGAKQETRGRSLAAPKTLMACIRQQSAATKNWLKRFCKVWSVPGNSLGHLYKQVPSQNLGQIDVAVLQGLAEQLKQLSRDSETLCQEVLSTIDDIAKVVSGESDSDEAAEDSSDVIEEAAEQQSKKLAAKLDKDDRSGDEGSDDEVGAEARDKPSEETGEEADDDDESGVGDTVEEESNELAAA